MHFWDFKSSLSIITYCLKERVGWKDTKGKDEPGQTEQWLLTQLSCPLQYQSGQLCHEDQPQTWQTV